tara:strand:- start:130 stop:249 length:120 start_codon:yes stop_codon:yes gene_type:complete
LQQLISAELAASNDTPSVINGMYLKNVLGQIKTNDSDIL